MSDFVNAILNIIYIFSKTEVLTFLNISDISDTAYILFNVGFWLVLGIYFNFIYRLTKFLNNLFF